MATAALSCWFQCIVVVMVWMFLCVRVCLSKIRHIYTPAMLRKVGFSFSVDITMDYQQLHNIPLDIARSLGTPWVVVVGPRGHRRQRRERRQKWGCRGGLLEWLRKKPYRAMLSSIFLTNVRSIFHKTDKLELLMANTQIIWDCSVMIFTETWLHLLIPDSTIQ